MVRKFHRLVGQPCIRVRLLPNSETIMKGPQCAFKSLTGWFFPGSRGTLSVLLRSALVATLTGWERYIGLFISVVPWPLSFISLTSTPISLDMSPSLLGVCQSGSHGTHSFTPDKIRMHLLKACKLSHLSANYFSAFTFALDFYFLKNSQFSG